jgi:hypothetical protein
VAKVYILNFLVISLCGICVVFQIASPNLCENQRQRREHPEFYHCKLKYVELHGWVGQMIEIELAIDFPKNAISLEHITFGPHSRPYLGGGRWFDGYDRLSHWTKTRCDLICEELQDYVNGSTRLIFL